jgi:hypothetical protein
VAIERDAHLAGDVDLTLDDKHRGHQVTSLSPAAPRPLRMLTGATTLDADGLKHVTAMSEEGKTWGRQRDNPIRT